MLPQWPAVVGNLKPSPRQTPNHSPGDSGRDPYRKARFIQMQKKLTSAENLISDPTVKKFLAGSNFPTSVGSRVTVGPMPGAFVRDLPQPNLLLASIIFDDILMCPVFFWSK